jgi:hypothetical protein
MKSWSVDKIQKVVIVFWNYCCVLFVSNSWCSALQIKLSKILACQLIFSFQYNSPYYYQYTSKAAVFKLSFWVSWYVMLLMCCRLQELGLFSCCLMTDSGLLDGIGSLHELTSLRLRMCRGLTAQALSTFLHRPSMTSMLSLNLSRCSNLDDEGLKGVAKRCNKLTYLHI